MDDVDGLLVAKQPIQDIRRTRFPPSQPRFLPTDHSESPMEHAGISLEAGLQDQLDQFDFDEFLPELEPEAFDFGLEGSNEQAEHSLAGDTADDAGAPLDPDPNQEAHGAPTAKQALITVAAEEAGNAGEAATEAGVEYQDEIGYEDEDLVNMGINADLSITDIGEAEGGLLTTLTEGHQDLESAQLAGDGLTELLTHDKDASWDEDINFEEHSEPVNPQDEPGSGGEEEAAEHLEDNDITVADFHDESAHEQLAADHHDDDLDKALDDLSHSLSDAPDIEVLYNEECYSLFGTSDDDPESYFLSDVQELDRPLSHFLTALRAVISDDLAPTDVVVIRFEPFDIEFGQQSDATFLNHTFREILDCHTTLSRVPGISADPVIHLMVRRDNEEHFLELLARAELVKDSPYDTEDSEMSENPDEESGADGLDDGQMQGGPNEGGESNDLVEEAGHAPTAHGEDANEPEPEPEITPIQGDAAGEPEQHFEAGANAPRSPSVAADAFRSGEHSESNPAETHPHEALEDGAGDEQAWDEQLAEDGAGEEQPQDEQAAENGEAGSQHAAVPLETSDEQSHQQVWQEDGNESTEAADLNTVDESAAPENGGHEQEAGSIGKYPSFDSPTSLISLLHKSPATLLPLHSSDNVSGLINSTYNEEMLVPPFASRAQDIMTRLPHPPDAPASVTVDQPTFWEIDYSDDEFEPAPSKALENGTPAASKSQGQTATALAFKMRFKSACTLTASGPRDVRRIFAFDTEADKYAHEDDDLILAFDDDHDLPAIHEEGDEHEDYIVTYDAPESVADDAEGAEGPVVAGTVPESFSEDFENDVHAAAVAESESVHTSTTLNGDEIDYDEENDAAEAFTFNDGAPQSTTTSGVDNDEIDWENDEDGDEQKPPSGDEGVEYEESKEAALTPSSVAGKRSRTDEAESLADETGMLECPLLKRLRMR